MTNVKFGQELSINGHSFDVLRSGVQKYIKRNISYKALYCTNEILLFKNIEGGTRLLTQLYNRLIITYMEDISIESLYLMELIDKFVENDTLNIVKYMCSQKKNTLLTNVFDINNIDDNSKQSALEYDDIKKIHKNIDKIMKENNFEYLAGQFHNLLIEKKIESIYVAQYISNMDYKLKGRKKKPVWAVFDTIKKVLPDKYMKYYNIALKWFNKLKKQGHLCWGILILIIIYEPNIDEFNYEVDDYKFDNNIEFDKYVYDEHTKIGKIDKDYLKYIDEIYYVDNENIFNKNWKDFTLKKLKL